MGRQKNRRKGRREESELRGKIYIDRGRTDKKKEGRKTLKRQWRRALNWSMFLL